MGAVAAAGAPPLGVRDGGQAERHRHPAGAVLLVHLLEREGPHRVLVDPRTLLDDQHVEPGLGEQGGGRGTTGAGADDHHLGVDRQTLGRDVDDAVRCTGRTHRVAPSARVSGHVSQMYA